MEHGLRHRQTRGRDDIQCALGVDNFSRECLSLEAGTSLTGRMVAACLDRVARLRGYPGCIRVDNGAEFYSRAMGRWAYLHGVSREFIRPGTPVEKSYVEGFYGRLRGGCLNVHLFFGLGDARRKLAGWREDYTTVRQHGALRN